MKVGRSIRWIVLAALILALILVPFALVGKRIEAWTAGFIATAEARPWVTGSVLAGLLASDILFPIPSSMVSTAAGFLLGFLPGLAASFLGMTVSCAAGYWIGRSARPFGLRLVGPEELERLRSLHERLGSWIVVVVRPVPVLAEASVLVAGMAGMSWRRFVLMTALANLGVSAVYAAVGRWASDIHSFLLAFAAAVALPGLAMLAARKRQG